MLAEARLQGIPGSGSRWRWLFSGIWLAYLIQPVSQLFDHHGALWIAGGVALTIAFCVLYLPVLMFSDTRPRLAAYGLVALAGLAATACLGYGRGRHTGAVRSYLGHTTVFVDLTTILYL